MNILSSIFSLFRDKIVYSESRSIGFGWEKVRRGYLIEHPYCEICGYLPDEDEQQNDVHHIIPRHIRPEGLKDRDNLMTLCRRYGCHLRFGHFGNYRKYWNPMIREIFGNCGGRMRSEETTMFVRALPRCRRKENGNSLRKD